jgi:hypothetical protein
MIAGLVLEVEKCVGTKLLLGSRLDGKSGERYSGESRDPEPSTSSNRISVYLSQADWRPRCVPAYMFLNHVWRMSISPKRVPGISEKCNGKTGQTRTPTHLLTSMLTATLHSDA